MKPREALDEGQRDMFRSRLDQIIDMGHPKAVLARKIDWRHLAERFGERYSLEPGHPALSTRLMAGLQILKYTENLSDEVLCARWVENPFGRKSIHWIDFLSASVPVFLRRGVLPARAAV